MDVKTQLILKEDYYGPEAERIRRDLGLMRSPLMLRESEGHSFVGRTHGYPDTERQRTVDAMTEPEVEGARRKANLLLLKAIERIRARPRCSSCYVATNWELNMVVFHFHATAIRNEGEYIMKVAAEGLALAREVLGTRVEMMINLDTNPGPLGEVGEPVGAGYRRKLGRPPLALEVLEARIDIDAIVKKEAQKKKLANARRAAAVKARTAATIKEARESFLNSRSKMDKRIARAKEIEAGGPTPIKKEKELPETVAEVDKEALAAREKTRKETEAAYKHQRDNPTRLGFDDGEDLFPGQH